MSVRVYLAAGRRGVESLAERGELSARAFRVTEAMRAAAPSADEEDLEYEASLAAEEALREAGEDVVVVAADAAERDVAGTESGDVLDGVSRSVVVSYHVAEHGAADDEELLWYDATELGDVLEYLDTPQA